MSEENKGFNPEYDDNKNNNTIYFSPAIDKPDGSSYRKVELLINEKESYVSDKNTFDKSQPIEFKIKDIITLYKSSGGQQKIHCWLIEDTRGKQTPCIYLSRRTKKGVYGSQEIVLYPETVLAFEKFLSSLKTIDTPNRTSIPLTSIQEPIDFSGRIITESEFIELIRSNITSTDDFYNLISIQKMNLAIEQLQEIIRGAYKNEVEIQGFLKDNLWMFGNDYTHIVEQNKINTKNILDMIPNNYESYIDIIEVKLPVECLFKYDEGHSNFYPTSKLTKAIAQTQNYLYELELMANDTNYQKENKCTIIKPKGIIIYGSGVELSNAEMKYLRILNSSYHNIQIITYQQLLEKARNTLNISNSQSKQNGGKFQSNNVLSPP